MKSIHFNNHVLNQETTEQFAMKLFKTIIEQGEKTVVMSIDDGDGDIYKHTLTVTSERVKAIDQIKEN
jgi:DNA polymerase IIIc chi subunit